MASVIYTSDRPAAPPGVPPPRGATLASFALFGSLAALVAMLYAAGEWLDLAGGFGFSSDAAWMRAVFARNLAAGEGLCFNPGQPAAGAAAFSWIAALWLPGLLGADLVAAAKIAGVLCVALCSYLTWHITLRLLGDWRFAFIAGLLVASSPRLAGQAMGGGEGAWAALLAVAAVHWQAMSWYGGNRQRAAAAVLAGLAALARPELLLLPPLLLADRALMALAHEKPTARVGAFLRSLPEFGGAAAVIAPYVVYNLRAGGPWWQRPELVLRPLPVWGWAAATLAALWRDNPLVCVAAALGVVVAAVSAWRPRTRHPSLLIVMLPAAVLLAPGLIWRHAGTANAAITAAYLTPVAAVLSACGLFLLYRSARQWASSLGRRPRRTAFAAGIGVVCLSVFALAAARHPRAWREHAFEARKVNDLQVYLGRWAADHLPPDASIASREVGAIGFFSRRRMVDLGGTVSGDALAYLRRPGSPDAHLLEYLGTARPSHLAIRPSDFPDLSQRADLLTPAVTCVVTNTSTGGVTTLTLYETPWPPLSVMEARAQAGRR